jgi:transposase InsO family protein
MDFKFGRDRLFEVLRNYGLLIKQKKNYKRTTQSHHRYRKYKNLIKDREIKSCNEVFVADLTYISLESGHCYLSLITDLYSRKIVGWNLSEGLDLESSEKALEMSLKEVKDFSKLVHHSDRGAQYCSPRYVRHLESRGAQVSMTEERHVYENAVAERVNGILKNEFIRVKELSSFRQAHNVVTKAIKIYNEQRLHTALNYRTPAECHIA